MATGGPRTIQEGLVPLGPLDTYNGVPVHDLCLGCRTAIAQYEHKVAPDIIMCARCSALVMAEHAPPRLDDADLDAMEAMFRRFVDGCYDANGVPCLSRLTLDHPACGECDGCAGAALLARIDAARAG